MASGEPERVVVTDPAHPLFGREFVLAATREAAGGGHAYVVFRGDVLLKVPLGATNLVPTLPRPPSSKLSLEAVRELVRLARQGGRAEQSAMGGTSAVEWVEGGPVPAPGSARRAMGGEP
ncbi:hypothetical protein [Roseomonas chloroacetimidivorans]|uniref:hypothetical protein n=1 Tax=Roseomonas chloroacetimidivorans TaxID=1766656 RepID=UPI003C757CA5